MYVDTSRDIDDADQAIELRWRQLKQDLEAQGTETATVTALGQAVGTDRDLPGPHGQALIAAHGHVVLAEELPDPPVPDRARFDLLPDAMPLAAQHAPDIPYAAVGLHLARDAGPADGQELAVELQAGHWPTSRVAGGQRHRWRVPVEVWQQGAARVAEQLMTLADHGQAEVIVLGGDVWARGVCPQLPNRLQSRIFSTEDHGPGSAPGRALLETELSEVLRGRRRARDRARIDRFLAHRARHNGGAAEGLMAVVEALRRGQADVLLINQSARWPPLWVGTAPKQVGLSGAELRAYGVQSSWQEPADAALRERQWAPAPS